MRWKKKGKSEAMLNTSIEMNVLLFKS